ncbi:hypothetical protein HMPREF9568_00006 [Cutibacterium acnes HL013PA2]|nr:hypothetical protein HMPREF9568_00006 [Cutibacterium acnes HL013PA2]
MGKGPLIFVLDKARFPYDLVKAAVDRCRSRMRLDMALSQKFDNLLGILGAGAFFIGVVVFVMAPFLKFQRFSPWYFPGALWTHRGPGRPSLWGDWCYLP